MYDSVLCKNRRPYFCNVMTSSSMTLRPLRPSWWWLTQWSKAVHFLRNRNIQKSFLLLCELLGPVWMSKVSRIQYFAPKQLSGCRKLAKYIVGYRAGELVTSATHFSKKGKFFLVLLYISKFRNFSMHLPHVYNTSSRWWHYNRQYFSIKSVF